MEKVKERVMGTRTKIEWTEAVWNPVTGCSKVSQGCKNCYAERMTARLQEMETEKYAAGFGQVVCHPEDLEIPLKRKKPTVYFVNSMSDLFHPDVPFEFIDQVFAVMALTPQHTYQVLTKRPDRMRKYLLYIRDEKINPLYRAMLKMEVLKKYGIYGYENYYPLRNVWLGVSVEDQGTADERVPVLLECPAAVRFVSYEPALGPVSLDQWFMPSKSEELWGVDWVICGGESGPGARPMHPDWARRVRDECQWLGVPFFFKQWGEYLPLSPVYPDEYGIDIDITDSFELGNDFPKTGVIMKNGIFYDGIEWQAFVNSGAYWTRRLGKKLAGRLLDGREWNEMPEVE